MKIQIIFIYVSILLVTAMALQSSGFDYDTYFQAKVKEYHEEAISIRRHLHSIPEPCLKETGTAAFIAEYLKKCGLEVHTGIAGTGIKAILKGSSETPVIGVRADMDALPISEETGFDYQSKNTGFMHACGHDGHMTNALITAKILSEIKEKLPGTVVFIFQPCEEGAPDGAPSGADRMVSAGVLENPKIEKMIGLHVMPNYPAGTAALREGPLMANVASVYITIKGKSSHGAFPHQGIDAIYAASCAILQFQSLISRSKNPNEQAVLTIGKISGGVRLNVIAEKVQMEGTARSFSFETESLLEKGMENILKGLKEAMGIDYEFKFVKTSQFVKNDPILTERLSRVFKRLLGPENVLITPPVTIGEDFSIYSHQIPSLFFFLGTGTETNLHTPNFSMNEDILKYGPLLFCGSVIELMAKQ